MSGETSKKKIAEAAEIIRKGGTLLHEPCPKCGGLQIRYKERIICLTCSDISDARITEVHLPSDILTGLRDMALNKLLEVSNLLRVESNPDKQSNLVSLSLKYVELVDRINKSIECKSEKK